MRPDRSRRRARSLAASRTDRARRVARLAGELRGPGADLVEAEPHRLGCVGQRIPQRERALEVRQSLREPEDGLRLARRRHRRDQRFGAATRCRPVRRELRRGGRPAARELLGEPPVHLLALARQDRRVDRLGQERVAEAEAAGRPVGDEDAVFDRAAQRLTQLVLRERRQRAQQRVPDIAPGRRGQTQQGLRPSVEPGHAPQQRLAQAARELAALISGDGKQLLGEERVALRASDNRVRHRRERRRVGAGRQQRHQLLVGERPDLEHERRARAPHAVCQPAHALRRRGLVRAVGRQQREPPLVEVVREEDDEVERRRIRPVQILQHQQHGRGGRAFGEQRERLLEHPKLRAGLARKLSERTQRLDERLVRKLRADEIDRAAEEDLESFGASARRELGREPGLADARLSGDEDGRAAPRLRRVERAPERLQLACASDEHAASIPPLPPAGKARVSPRRRQDTQPAGQR